MPDLNFSIAGVEPAARSLAPLLQFKLRINTEPACETIHGALLNAQIHIQSPLRPYEAQEKEKLVEIFGTPERWPETLRNKFWAHSHATVNTFAGSTETVLPVACTFDLNVLATKYFSALEGGEVPLLFLFSGSVFYAAGDGRLQVQRIPWEKECLYRMPLRVWKDLMQYHFPNTAWLTLEQDSFDRLCAFKRRTGQATWEQTIERLLAEVGEKEAAA